MVSAGGQAPRRQGAQVAAPPLEMDLAGPVTWAGCLALEVGGQAQPGGGVRGQTRLKMDEVIGARVVEVDPDLRQDQGLRLGALVPPFDLAILESQAPPGEKKPQCGPGTQVRAAGEVGEGQAAILVPLQAQARPLEGDARHLGRALAQARPEVQVQVEPAQMDLGHGVAGCQQVHLFQGQSGARQAQAEATQARLETQGRGEGRRQVPPQPVQAGRGQARGGEGKPEDEGRAQEIGGEGRGAGPRRAGHGQGSRCRARPRFRSGLRHTVPGGRGPQPGAGSACR